MIVNYMKGREPRYKVVPCRINYQCPNDGRATARNFPEPLYVAMVMLVA